MASDLTFNIDHGYLEGLVRGFKGGLLTASDYANLVQCDTLDGMQLVLFDFPPEEHLLQI